MHALGQSTLLNSCVKYSQCYTADLFLAPNFDRLHNNDFDYDTNADVHKICAHYTLTANGSSM